MRSILVRRITVGAAAVAAATGGLAVAGALPGPARHATATVASSRSHHADETDDDTSGSVSSPTGRALSTPSSHPENHGAEVSQVARDHSVHGCDHGRAVSAVASGKKHPKPCPDHGPTGPRSPKGS